MRKQITIQAISFIFILSFFHLQAQDVDFVWAKSMGGMGGDNSNSLAVDTFGNVYITGSFEGTVDFNPSTAPEDTFNLTSNGGSDIFIQKLDGDGNFIWAKLIASSLSNSPYSIVLDNVGNVYITGFFYDTVDFDPSTAPEDTFNLTSNGEKDIFILKLDGDGNFIWAKSMGGRSDDIGNSLVIDTFENVYITGYFKDTVDFNPSTAPEDTFNLTSNGYEDIFIQKLDANGDFIWAKSMGGTSYDEGKIAVVDSDENVYITGFFEGTVDFNPSTAPEDTFNLTFNGGGDIFIQKLDVNGDFIWAKSMGNSNPDHVSVIALDNVGNVYTTGFFYETVDFNPSTAPGDTFNLTSNGGGDIFIQKLDVDGNFIWAKSMGGNDFDDGNSLAVDTDGNIYTIGGFEGTVDFNPSTAPEDTFNITSNFYGSKDIFIQKLDGDGNFIWVKSMGGIADDVGTSLALDNAGNVYTTGIFYETVDFNPSTAPEDTFNLTSNRYGDIFILKLRNILRNIYYDTVTTCGNSYMWNGTTYNISGSYVDTFANVDNQDSVVKLNLTINSKYNIIDTVKECAIYTWIDGNIYISDNNTAKYTTQTVNGCDSIVTLNLTINEIYIITDVQEACESYTWTDGGTYTSTDDTASIQALKSVDNCDSIVILNLTINAVKTSTYVKTECDTFIWIDGNTYTSDNDTAKYTTKTVDGCDSVVTLNLTITKINDNVTSKNGVLSAIETGATYQWVDCNDTYSDISGETNKDYTVTTTGNYAVIITKNSCIDTSNCENVTITGIGEIENNQNFIVYPNPTNGEFTIEWNYDKKATISIVNLKGQSIYQKTILGKQQTKIQLPKNISSGVYNLKLQTDNATINKKIYIQKD